MSESSYTDRRSFAREPTLSLLNEHMGRPHALVTGVNMAVANTDNQFVWRATPPTLGVVRRIIARRVSGAFGVACLGGIYTGASKGGTAIVAAAQSYAGLTGAGKIADLSLVAAVATDILDLSNLYVNLSTANTGALVADFYLWVDAIAP